MRLCLFVLALSIISANAQDQFKPNGDPFHNFENATDFDSKCPKVTGNAKPNTGGAKQNTVKNNLAAKGSVKDISIDDLVALQKEIEKDADYDKWSATNAPKTRAPFHNMSGDFQEGELVRITAYVFEAHTADMESTGESVNCNYGTGEKAKNQVSEEEASSSNDIHIALVDSRTDKDECKSVTAEVIPHFRPAMWDEALFKKTLKRKLVRLTGQLMFDASHKPCTDGKKSSPARQSLWEVHPVYRVEQCSSDDGHGTCTGGWKVIS